MRLAYEALYTNQSPQHTQQIKNLLEGTVNSFYTPRGKNFSLSEDIPKVSTTVKLDSFIPQLRPKLLTQNPFYAYSALKKKIMHRFLFIQDQKPRKKSLNKTLPMQAIDLTQIAYGSDKSTNKINTNRFFQKRDISQLRNIKSQQAELFNIPIPNQHHFKYVNENDDKKYVGYQLDRSSNTIQDYLQDVKQKQSNAARDSEGQAGLQKLKSKKIPKAQPNLPINQHNLVEQIKHASPDTNEYQYMNSPEKYQMYKKRALSKRFSLNRKKVNIQINSRSISSEAYYQQRNQFQIRNSQIM